MSSDIFDDFEGVFVDTTTGAGTGTIRTVALADGAAPGSGTFGVMSNLRLNGLGEAAFTSETGVFQEVGSTLEAVAREGEAARPPRQARTHFSTT